MAESIVSDIVVKLLEYTGKSAYEAIAPYFKGKGELQKLNQTLRMIQSRLSDAERRGEEGGNEDVIKEWLKSLKAILYRLEDLFEEVTIADHVSKEMLLPRGKLNQYVCISFSRSNKKVAQEAKAIMKELNSATSIMSSLNFREQKQPTGNLISRDQTYSFFPDEEVFGRDEDKREIIRMLLEFDNVGDNVSVIPIVGIGGIGKTTLSQIAFSDKNVQKYFELKGWACIGEICTLEELVRKVLQSVTHTERDKYHNLAGFSMEELQSHLREALNDKRYLLVLDDMWDEDRERWLAFERLLRGGKFGSRVIVTTRSRVVANNMGTVEPYQLKGLAEDKSLALFKRLAFKKGQEESDPNMMVIGEEIVKKCANVPLAIRTIAALLYSKNTEQEWENFRNTELRMINSNENNIMSSLKLSYNHLPSHLKRCFAYCSLFPKDYTFDKHDLIYLWMAQGFIRPLDGSSSQSLEDVGHGYFMELFRRSFFQEAPNVLRDDIGDVTSCTMHDLMHDLAQDVAGNECVLVNRPPTEDVNVRIKGCRISPKEGEVAP